MRQLQLKIKNFQLTVFLLFAVSCTGFAQPEYWGTTKMQDSILTAYDSLAQHLLELSKLKDSLKNIYTESQVNSLLALYYTQNQIDAFSFLTEETDPAFVSWDRSSGISILENQIMDLNHFTGSDITGMESAFAGWDKNLSDDYTTSNFNSDFAGKSLDDLVSGSTNIHLTTSMKNNYDAAYLHLSSTSNPHSITKAQVGLSNVENTALSTWAGSSNISWVGTITSGTWNAGSISSSGTIVTGGDITVPAVSGLIFFSRGRMEFFGDGQVRIRNNAGNGFDRMVFGIATNAYPALKRTNTGLEAYLGDGSAYTWFAASSFSISSDTAYGTSWNNRKTAASKDAVFDKIESIADASNSMFIRVISADNEPDIPGGSCAIWIDTNDSDRRYLLSDSGGIQKKTELQ